jgi:hypothetical protein
MEDADALEEGAVRRLQDALFILQARFPEGRPPAAEQRLKACDAETWAIVDLAYGGWTIEKRYCDEGIEEIMSIVATREPVIGEYRAAG